MQGTSSDRRSSKFGLRPPACAGSLVFSGDLGQPDRPILRDPTPIADADCLWIESTYGDRLHRAFDATRSELIEALHDVLQVRHGNVIIPAFAVGRTQEILVVLAELVRSGDVQPLQVYVDFADGYRGDRTDDAP